jgi:hypothetical protein
VLAIAYAQSGLRVDGLDAHDPHQPGYTLVIDPVALSVEPGRHTTDAVERGLQILPVDQAHQLQFKCGYLNWLVVKARSRQTQ